MRDVEFAEIFESIRPKLDMYFHKRIKQQGFNVCHVVLKDDLIQMTALEVLVYSRKPKYIEYSMETLIFLRAREVWEHYVEEKNKRLIVPLEAVQENQTMEMDQLQSLVHRETLANLQQQMSEESWRTLKLIFEGYDYKTIKDIQATTEGAIKMRIKRLREQLKNSNYRENNQL